MLKEESCDHPFHAHDGIDGDLTSLAQGQQMFLLDLHTLSPEPLEIINERGMSE